MTSRASPAGVQVGDASAPQTPLAVPVRIITATALFDGHDASINLIRRFLQEAGAEVVHLGHNRSVEEIVRAAIQEDAHAVAVSSYQGGHNEFFAYLRERLDGAGGSHIRVYGGGGGVILRSEAEALNARGVARIFTAEDGMRLGLGGMVEIILEEAAAVLRPPAASDLTSLSTADQAGLARALTAVESDPRRAMRLDADSRAGPHSTHVIGFTGPGGAGKSSLVDEVVLRLGRDFPELAVAVICVDPTKRRSGGALLGDRLRMNAMRRPGVFFRSLATRGSGSELSPAIQGAMAVFRLAGFPLVLLETAGTGQGSSGVVDEAGTSVYVMTPEFGAPTQLEKIDMLDYADLVAMNKIDRRAAEDALESVVRQLRRAGRADAPELVFGTCASSYGDEGVERLYRRLVEIVEDRTGGAGPISAAVLEGRHVHPGPGIRIVARDREDYLVEAARTIRDYHRATRDDLRAVGDLEAVRRTLAALRERSTGEDSDPAAAAAVAALAGQLENLVSESSRKLLPAWDGVREAYSGKELVYRVRGRELRAPLHSQTLAGVNLPRVAVPRLEDRAELLRFLRCENLPGRFPFTAGVFPLRRTDEQPTRQFAGEGPPERTNRRFHLLCEGQPAVRLSTAFDSVTLYGQDPDERPDIYGKVGESGVSIATLDDMKRLYAGFDLASSSTSVSMTINGPAPTILAMFFNTAIDQQVDRFRRETGREPRPEELERLSDGTLQAVRGTVQADILKEDQAQNTCLFATAFSVKMMGDVQEFFVEKGIRNFYSVSVSGYHIAEAGANPVTQLAFTLANGLTYAEYYLSRGMAVDDFAPNFSFFFSMGLDPEYSVIGRVARRVWAIVMRDRYGAGERSQKLKYHIQTSGRSLHAREVVFNDIRTTLQALMAYYDGCNSLHTNAYDEAVTTPTEESVRRALAIQLIIQREMGLAANENPLQGSFLIEELTDLVEEAVLCEFERISSRGGVPGAMESGYLRSKIQEESRLYEESKQSGRRPVVGINTFVDPAGEDHAGEEPPVVRATREEKDGQIRRLREFHRTHRKDAVRVLGRLREVAIAGGNTFAVLMEAARHASLGQITGALFEVGGAYRRMM